jgi:hypothetical protein
VLVGEAENVGVAVGEAVNVTVFVGVRLGIFVACLGALVEVGAAG